MRVFGPSASPEVEKINFTDRKRSSRGGSRCRESDGHRFSAQLALSNQPAYQAQDSRPKRASWVLFFFTHCFFTQGLVLEFEMFLVTL